MGKWDAHRGEIRRMVDLGKTDAEIGVVYQVTGAAIYQARQKHGIKRPPAKNGALNFGPKPVEPLIGETYTDECGLTVTRFPARYARNAEVQVVTARPRRG